MRILTGQDMEQVEKLISQMTTEEKVGQLNQPPLSAERGNLADLVEKGEIGSLVLAYTPFAGSEQHESEVSFRKELQRIAVEESRLGIPLLFGRDVIHGHRTVFPIPLMQANSWNPDLVEQLAAAAAKEAKQEEIHWSFAPMLDVARDPRWGRIIESFGEDPCLASAMSGAAVRGFQSAGIAACAKHFIGYGAAEGGRDYNTTELSDYTLRNIYLPPFESAVRAGVMTVMASFNDVSGEPVTASSRLLTSLLKEELGFEGFVVSDWDAVAQLICQGVAASRKEAAGLAFLAGIDMDMASGCFSEYLTELVEDGTVPMLRLEDAVRRILKVKMKLGLFDVHSTKAPMYIVPSGENLKLAHKAAVSSMVLLKNERSILPLPNGTKDIVLLGSFAQERRSLLGSWTLDGIEEEASTLEDEIRLVTPEVTVLNSSRGLSPVDVDSARKADAVIVALGEYWDNTGEARGSSTLQLPEEQLSLLREAAAINKNIVAVVFAGRPVILEEVSRLSKAVLCAGHAGTKTAKAAVDILFGSFNPCGKLSTTFPRSTGQLPVYYNHRSAGRKIDEYFGDANIRNYQDDTGSPLYPFGYGLQYTNYRYGSLTADKTVVPCGQTLTLSVEITNAGDITGTETIQCYISAPPSAFVRPVRELRQFQQVKLEPGESKIVQFKLYSEDIAYSYPDGKREVVIGRYTAWIGCSCIDVHSIDFDIVGVG